jgi:hypothetical protein
MTQPFGSDALDERTPIVPSMLGRFLRFLDFRQTSFGLQSQIGSSADRLRPSACVLAAVQHASGLYAERLPLSLSLIPTDEGRLRK